MRVLRRRRDQLQYLGRRHLLVASVEAHRALKVAQRAADVFEFLRSAR